VLDDELPDRGGEALYRELRKRHHDLPIVISSRAHSEALAARLADDPCLAVIARPYTAGQLQDTLRALNVRCRGRAE
jgi:DNA-binding response OmpR family regulator